MVALADWLACCAFSAFFFTVADSSSIAAEVSSRLAACSSVRCERSVVLVEISAEALVTSRPEALISAIVVLTFSAIARPRWRSARFRPCGRRPGTSMAKLPPATILKWLHQRPQRPGDIPWMTPRKSIRAEQHIIAASRKRRCSTVIAPFAFHRPRRCLRHQDIFGFAEQIGRSTIACLPRPRAPAALSKLWRA